MKDILRVKELRKNFGGNAALGGVNLSAEPAKITAIIGPNGSGKSTLFNVLTCSLPKDSGSSELAGRDIVHESDYHLARDILSRTFQETRAFEYLTIREHLEMACREDDEKFFKNFLRGRVNEDDRIKKTLAQVGLEQPLDMLGGELSYGQTKLLMIAMAILKKHKMLFLDEPVAGVNPRLRVKVGEILKNLRAAGETILLIEHDMNFVLSLADKIIVMDLGKVVIEGTPDEILANKRVLQIYLGR